MHEHTRLLGLNKVLTLSTTAAAMPPPNAQVFFCKYNDPLYVKMEKLEVMIRLANDKNIDQVGMSAWQVWRRGGPDACGIPAAAAAARDCCNCGIGLHLERSAAPPPSQPVGTSPPPLQVLLELKEYAQEVDVDFVRKVRCWHCRTATPGILRLWFLLCGAQLGPLPSPHAHKLTHSCAS